MLVFASNAPINVILGGGGAGRGGDFDILSKLFVKNHSPGATYFVKKHKNPHPRAGEVCQMFIPRGNAIHSRHQISATCGMRESIKSKATPSGMNALSKSSPPRITLIGA